MTSAAAIGLRRLLRQERRRRADMQRMVGGEHRGALHVGQHAGAQRLGQGHAIGPLACSPREPRPIRITGCFAARSIATACATCSGATADATSGTNRDASIGGSGSASGASCMPASRLIYTGPIGAERASQ